MTAKEHYDGHLGNFYAWMVGDFTEKQVEQRQFFLDNHILPRSGRLAFDLGAGHGLQSFALASLGYNVKAVDFNTQLLSEIISRKKKESIEVIHDDLINFLTNAPERPELIVSMGDTISHLPTTGSLETLITQAFKLLTPGGRLILSFRDLTKPLNGNDRFIHVNSDDTRILTCFLEYFDDHVMVYDILYEKKNEQWIQKISHYPKLRLNQAMLNRLLEKNGFRIVSSSTVNRMIYIIAES